MTVTVTVTVTSPDANEAVLAGRSTVADARKDGGASFRSGDVAVRTGGDADRRETPPAFTGVFG